MAGAATGHPPLLGGRLGVKKPLDEIFDIGNRSIGGDTDTLCQVAFLPGKHYE